MAEPTAAAAPRHVFLIDGSGFIFRAFHALPPLTRGDGTPVNAVLGFINMLLKLLEDHRPDHIAIVFDAARTTFRNEIYPAYKANRPDPPEELVPQFGLVREATRALNLPSIEIDGFEADDVIATYTRMALEAGAEVTVVSSDKDLMQLVGGRVGMFDALRSRRIGVDEVKEKFGVGPERVGDVLALAGDSTDNVPGVPGIGVKTAAELINAFGDLEAVLARADEVRQPKRRETLVTHADEARLSRRLVELRRDAPVPVDLDGLARKQPDPEVLIPFLREQNFRSVLARVESRLAAEGVDTGAPPPPVEAAYELVQDLEALGRWIEEARAAGVVAVDTETTSLDAMRAELVGVSLSVEPGKACYIPVGHRPPAGDGGEVRQIERDATLTRLKPLLEDSTVLKVGQNVKYDMLVLGSYGVGVKPVDDTMLISYVLEAGRHEHGMDELANRHLDVTPISYKDVAGTGKSQVTFDKVPLDKALDYAAEDADVTGRLHRVLKPRLVAERMVTVYETLERPLIPVLVAMERAGIMVDREELMRLSRDFAQRLVALEEEIYRLAGHPFTIASPKQLGEVLFDEMGLEGGKKGKTGAYGTGADVLESLAAQGHDLPARVLDWRQLAKLKSTYADALIEQINPATGRVHTSYSMAVASTGRLSSTDPNLQNIPVRTEEGRKIRRAFVAAPGHKLVSADYSQIELRLLAHVAAIDALVEAFHAGADIHALTAAQVFGVPVEGMDPVTRRSAKAINFGIIYGISPFGLSRQLGVSQGDAAAYIRAYFERYPGIRDYMERTKTFCRQNGFVTTLFGRKCHMPGINDKNPARRGFWERAAINAPLQGSAADIIKRAMIRIPGALDEAGLEGRMLLQVHDELLFEAPEDEVEATAAVAKRVMEGVAHLSVPLTVDTGAGDDWADAH
ncbi:MAG: DNA polymerase I [Alphaproteobacteria bacterium]